CAAAAQRFCLCRTRRALSQYGRWSGFKLLARGRFGARNHCCGNPYTASRLQLKNTSFSQTIYFIFAKKITHQRCRLMSMNSESLAKEPSAIQQRRQANMFLVRLQWLVILLLIAALLWLFISQQRFEHSIKDRKSTRLNSSHVSISYAVFCLKKKK